LGNVALDERRTLVEHRRHPRNDDLPEHKEDHHEADSRPEDVVEGGNQRVRSFLGRDYDKSVTHPVSLRSCARGLETEDEAGGDADEGQRLGEGDTDPHEDLEAAGEFGLASDTLDRLADDDAHA